MEVTAIANSNIAFVKYWGKKDELLNIPMNPSISMTLDLGVSTKTTVEFSKNFTEDVFIFGGALQSGEKLSRVTRFLDVIRAMARKSHRARVVSENSFPTGAGIASSASGYAALALAGSKSIGLSLDRKELSALARRGSGSASRSIYGGFVVWDGEYARQLHDEAHWPELRDIIVILDENEKKRSSREGMRDTVMTSSLYKERIRKVDKTLAEVRSAIGMKDFGKLAVKIMEDSDDLHSCMEDTLPKLVYLNEQSYEIKDAILAMNRKNLIAGYSFDAGPNPHIITLDRHVDEITEKITPISKKIIVCRPGSGVKLLKDEGNSKT